MGIYVLMDVMHALASENVLEDLGLFGRTDECYFRPGWGEMYRWKSCKAIWRHKVRSEFIVIIFARYSSGHLSSCNRMDQHNFTKVFQSIICEDENIGHRQYGFLSFKVCSCWRLHQVILHITKQIDLYRYESHIIFFLCIRREVQRCLLSNLRYYLDEFCFDGFKFRGVTSMIF